MRRIQYAVFMLPGKGRQPPHKSAGRLSARDAAEKGALYPIPGTVTYEWVPDPPATTDEKTPTDLPAGG